MDTSAGFGEWEVQEANHYAASEMKGGWEYEDELLSENVLQGMKNTAQNLIPQAKKLGAIASQILLATVPNFGTASLIPNRLLSHLIREGEATTLAMETQFFGSRDAEKVVGSSTVAYEAALTEVLAAEASHTPNKSEAAALLGAAVSSAIRSMGAQRELLPMMLPLIQIVTQLAQIFRQSGISGQKLQRILPTVLRRVIASLQAVRRAGQPIDSVTIARVTAAHVTRVLKDPTTLTVAIARNASIRKYTVKPGKPK